MDARVDDGHGRAARCDDAAARAAGDVAAAHDQVARDALDLHGRVAVPNILPEAVVDHLRLGVRGSEYDR